MRWATEHISEMEYVMDVLSLLVRLLSRESTECLHLVTMEATRASSYSFFSFSHK